MAPNPLPFEMQQQGCTEWCWAAVTSSIASFVKLKPQPEQCEIVDKEAFSPNNPSPGCCKQANRCKTSQVCNRRGNVGIILGNYNLTPDSSGQIPSASDFATIKDQIDACCVVVIEVVNRANPGLVHVMVVTGYRGDDTLAVADPADSHTHFTYSFSGLLSSLPGTSENSNWRMLKFFTTVPGLTGAGATDA